MEKTFSEYVQFISGLVTAETIKKSMDSVGRVGHFVRAEDGLLRPIYYPGFTLITPTSGDDDENAPLYKTLLAAQAAAAEEISPQKFVAAPANALHMTLGRLVSSEPFEKNILGAREDDLLRAFGEVLGNIPAQKSLLFEIKGIAVMHGIVAAMVATEDEESYRRLQRFRDAIYDDKTLTGYGVERKRGFTGHITLLYIEDELTSAEKEGICRAIIETNEKYFSTPRPFNIVRAEVRRFDNYLHFWRESDWPSFCFGL